MPAGRTGCRRETGIPLVATNDSHYLRKDDARAHEILMCIQTGKTMSATRTACASSTPDFYLKSRDEMMELFGELEDALDRTWEIAQRCQRQARKGRGAVPEVRRSAGAHHRHLLRIRRAPGIREAPRAPGSACGAKGTLKHDLAEYAERLDREIKMIQQMKFSGYFLIVWDFIRFAKDRGHSGGPGPRLGGRQPGQLRDGDHRHRSAAVRPAVRALPESGARQHARYRHRFLHEPAAAR